MMAPTAVLDADGEVELVLGSAGSNRIRSAILQVIVGVVDHGMRAHEAVLAPACALRGRARLRRARGPASTSCARPAASSSASAHRNLFFGGVQAVERDPRQPRPVRGGRPAARRRRGGRVRRRDRPRRCSLVALAAAAERLRQRAGRPVRRAARRRDPRRAAGLRVTDDGRASCNGRPLVDITSEQLVDARDIERELEPLARRGLALPPARGSILRYRAVIEDGAVRFADNSPRQPAPLFALAKLTRDIARSACGLAR